MNKDFVIIDANISRIKESLRGLEDIARHACKHRYVVAELKSIQHMLVSLEHHIGVGRLIQSRRGISSGRSGFGEKIEKESYNGIMHSNSTLWSIIRDNVARATQAFRAIESFIYIYKPSVAPDVESLRYKLYGIEKALLERTPHYWMHNYFESGVVYPVSSDVGELMNFVDNGAKIIGFTTNDLQKEVVYERAMELCRFLEEERMEVGHTKPVLIILHDQVELARQLPVAGVYINNTKQPISRIRQHVGGNKIIGISTSSVEEIDSVVEQGVNFIGFGPIYSEEKDKLDEFEKVVEHVEVPVVAFGGVNKKTADAVYECGGRSVMTESFFE